MFLTLPGDITTLQLHFAVQCCKFTAIKHGQLGIVCRTALLERRICSHKSSLRWSINSVIGNDLQ